MRIGWLLSTLLAAMAAVLAAALLVRVDPTLHVVSHAVYPTLLRAGGGAVDPLRIALGWGFGALQLAFFSACFALGVRRREGLGPLRRPILLGLLGYELVWAFLVLCYVRYAGQPDQPDVPLLLSFPLPTAVMLYLMWPFPLFFMVLYLRHFDRWVLPPGDLAHFRARIAALRGGAPQR